MAGSYSQILLHIVFSTKRRNRWITPGVAERLYALEGSCAPSAVCSIALVASRTTSTAICAGDPTGPYRI